MVFFFFFFFSLSLSLSLSLFSVLVLAPFRFFFLYREVLSNVVRKRLVSLNKFLQVERSSASCGLCNNGTCAMSRGFMKPRLDLLPLVIIAHAGPVGQSAPQLAESSALLVGSGVADKGLFLFAFILFVAVCG